MPISTISQTISTIPEAGRRGVDVQTVFVNKQEDFQDHLQGTTVTELNTLKSQINTTITGMNDAVTNVNTKASEADADALSANNSAGIATTKAGEASTSASQALASKNKAAQWADANYNVEVEAGKYSAKHWATVAQSATVGEDTKGANIASASTTTIGTTGLGDYIHITGTTTITSFGTAGQAGIRRTLIFDGALTVTHNATSLICTGGTNITTVAGMVIEVVAETTANWRVVSITHPNISMAELGYLDGVTSNIQTQLNSKFTTASASETAQGLIELATTAETQDGTDDTRAITPLKLRNALNATGAAPIYACRAWVNFNGTGTVAIRASGNVSSITDNGTGDYTMNFTTAMPDANYSCLFGAWGNSGTASWSLWEDSTTARTVNSLRIGATYNQYSSTSRADYAHVNVSIVR